MLFSACLLSLGLPFPVLSASVAADVRFEDRLIATLPEGIVLEGPPLRHPDGREIETRSPIHWSPDGRQVAYVGYRDGARHAVIGEDVSEAHDYVDSIGFGESGDDVVFRVGDRVSKKKEKWFLYRGPDQKKKPKKLDWIGAPAMAPDGSRVVCWNQPGAKMDSNGYYLRKDVVLFGGWKKKGGRYDDGHLLSAPVFSRDSSRVFSVLQQHGSWLVMAADKKGEHELVKDLTGVADFAVDPTGKHVAVAAVSYAYSASAGQVGFPFGGWPTVNSVEILLDGKKIGKEFDAAWSPVFSPSGKKLAYRVMKDGKIGICAEGKSKARLEWDFVSRPVFSPDGKSVAFAASRETTFAFGSATQRGAGKLKRSGKEQVHVCAVSSPHKCEALGEVADRIEHVQFGPQEDQVAYAARTEEGWRVHCGERKSDAYDEVGALHFDEDGGVIGFGARSGRELLWRTLKLTE